MIRALYLTLALLAFTTPGLAEDLWETAFDEGGVLVETRPVEGSDYKAFRARVQVAAPPKAVLTRLQDIDSYPDWFPDTLEARRIREVDGEWFNYVRTDAPWPVKDRDAVYRNRLSYAGAAIRIDIAADPTVEPESSKAVRVQKAGGFWTLTPVGSGTDIHWEFHLEPGGNIPANLANGRVVETPRRALRALKEYFGDV